jgi:hypothetical protein
MPESYSVRQGQLSAGRVPVLLAVFEANDEYFDYYRDYHAFWKLYGIGLPDQALKKLYNGNALKLTPGLARLGFTN